jgi:vanillate O-demethylase monooxygenase subunit
MSELKPFLENAWYMAAWSDEVADGLLRRRLLGEPVLLLRKEDGKPAALIDRCPHRFAPLSFGEREGDCVVCPYHGLTFDTTGACVRNPFSDRIPKTAKVRTFRVAERDDIVWLWPGDPHLADEATIPDFSAVRDQPGRKVLRRYTHVAAPYEFCTDNLLDLSHIEFVHRGTFAGEGVIFSGEHSLFLDGNTLHSNWWMPNVPAPVACRPPFQEGEEVDHWLDMRWNSPASMKLDIGATLPGRPREDGFHVGGQAHIVTPETQTTSHYFTASARHHHIDDTEMDAVLSELFRQAFDVEDKPIIEAAYANLDGGDFWDLKPVSLGVDTGGTRARRMIQKLKKEETAK